MSLEIPDSTIFLALVAGAFIGAVLILAGLRGRVDLTHPRCRRCRADLRPVAWALACGAHSGEAAPTPCPACGAPLHRRRVRWRPFPVRRRLVGLGVALLVACPMLHVWGSTRHARGLAWRDLGPEWLDVRAARRIGYPDPAGNFALGAPLEATWSGGPWRSLTRRATAGVISGAALAEIAATIDRSVAAEALDGAAASSPARPAFVRAPNWPAPHADLLIAILRSDLPRDLRAKAGAILVSPPTLVVSAVDGRQGPFAGEDALVQLNSAGAGQVWGDHSQSVGRSAEQGLDALFHACEVRLDGRLIDIGAEDGCLRSGTVVSRSRPGQRGLIAMPMFRCRLDATPGAHELSVTLDMAVVDRELAEALVASQGEPGPAERWGARTPVRRVTIKAMVVLVERSGVRERTLADQPRSGDGAERGAGP